MPLTMRMDFPMAMGEISRSRAGPPMPPARPPEDWLAELAIRRIKESRDSDRDNGQEC